MGGRLLAGSPVIKTLPCSTEGEGTIPIQGAKITLALCPKTQSIKQKQCCNKFDKVSKDCLQNYL